MIIDVSEHNGKLDWEKIKPQIEGAIIRCGFGSDYSKQDDAYYQRNVSECTRLGIPFGVYIYSYANTVTKARSEAAHVKRLVAGLNLAFPIFYDLEEERYSSYATKMANAWMEEMKDYDVGIYANVNWWKNYLKGVDCKKKWVAYWGKTKPSISDMVLWQYSDNGTVAGQSGFDLNQNIALPIPSPEPEPEPTPTPEPPAPTPEPKKSCDQLANEVLEGKWGDGAERKARLTAAGYDYYEVQDCVNEKLGIYKKYTVNVNTRLNVRKCGSTSCAVIRQLKNGDVVRVYAQKNGWGRIGQDEWVSMNYLHKYMYSDASLKK